MIRAHSIPSMSKSISPRAGAMQLALEKLRAMIILGELSPGEQIRQQEMAESLGISRVPLREAMNVLADQGQLLHKPNQGYFVAKRVPSDVVQVRRMLLLLENELLATVAWPNAEALARLRSLNHQIAASITNNDISTLSMLNREFHMSVFGLSPHHLILQEVERLWALADPIFLAKLTRPEYMERIVDEHERVIGALTAQDRNQLFDTMNQHRYGGGPAPALPVSGAHST